MVATHPLILTVFPDVAYARQHAKHRSLPACQFLDLDRRRIELTGAIPVFSGRAACNFVCVLPIRLLMTTNFLIGLLVILLHEAAHLTAALLLGINVKRIGVSWKGIYIVRESGPAMANMITTLAGPFANLLLAAVWPASHVFTWMNLIFGLVNLMPFGGSDGQRALTLTDSAVPRVGSRDWSAVPS